LLAFLAVGLSACTTLGLPGSYPGGYPEGGRYPDPGYGRYEDYRNTPEYRSAGRDADRYADLLDRELGLDGRQERDVEILLEQRVEGLLRNTHPRDHRYVYPFPRDQRLSATARRWWDDTDRTLNRYLDARQRDEYRYIARDLERYGRYDRDRYERRGAGHPVFGRRWCTDRGYYPDRDYDRRRDDDD
jgi:hypothetical protein